MIAAALTLVSGHLAAPVPDVSEFFPLNPGDEYTFHETGGGINETFTDKVGKPLDIKGFPAIPITTSLDGQAAESTYYRVDGSRVLIVAFDPQSPLDSPYAIIELEGRGKKWDYIGETTLMGAKAALKMEGRSRLLGERDVLGKKVEVLEVILDATVVDEEASAQMKQVVGLKSKQTALYARGIGLYEMKEEAQLGKSKSTRLRKLTKYTKAGAPADDGTR